MLDLIKNLLHLITTNRLVRQRLVGEVLSTSETGDWLLFWLETLLEIATSGHATPYRPFMIDPLANVSI